MSYDLEHVEKRCPCPCGKGEIVYGWGTNDWNQIREGMTEIWCAECDKKYKFSTDGLLPRDYPEYKGDEKAYKEMHRLGDIIANYRGMMGFRYWSDELCDKRKHQYLTDDEIDEDKRSGQPDNWVMAIGFAKDLADKYSFDELKEVYHQLSVCKYSTQLTGKATEIVDHHRRYYKTVKLSRVAIPVNMAVRNYTAYKQVDAEDEAYISRLKEDYEKAKAIYYKDYEKYEKERKKQLITYELKDVVKKDI